MKQHVFKFLKSYSTQPEEVDRLIISAFIAKNNLNVNHNKILKSFIIDYENKDEYNILCEFNKIIDNSTSEFNFEALIELFEFVISPADRIINGAIYTPLDIREYIISQAFLINQGNYYEYKIADISCGCGGFLFNIAKKLKTETELTYSEIFANNIFGLDIQTYSITRTKLLLSLLALYEGEDIEEFDFNLHVNDALLFNWNSVIENFNGFNIIVGNPPYVRLRNLGDDTKKLLKNWEVCKTGLIDLYIPFFQIGLENIAINGVLGYITMNSFFKSLNGRALRNYFQRKSLAFKIIDFGSDQIFKSKNTYTCICLIQNNNQDYIEYVRTDKIHLEDNHYFNQIQYQGLDSKKGWNLQSNKIISKIESTGIPFGEIYKTRHGIATLKNNIYIFKPVEEDEDFYYLQNGNTFKIEKEICKDVVNSNRLTNETSIHRIKEKIIFPYNNEIKPKLIEEEELQSLYPYAFEYLNQKKYILDKRDKGKGKYQKWFAFGRTQSLEKVENKLFFPKISNSPPNCILEVDENLLYYNGQAIIGHTQEEMMLIKKIMESRLFWYYITNTSKPYTSNYYSLNGNYINNFGICDLNDTEIEFILNENNKEVLNAFFENKYEISF
ncbi:MAG: Eco57I restriction-modification methylase domain-containing protein [Candidatus Sericytochromatia bacterium]|nr:Eco57I restriction-modification methylase domain-containing protein [Candidatus Sericytochromatia bacterium]